MTANTSNPVTRFIRAAFPVLLAVLSLLLSGNAAAQVSVTATAGTPGPTPYTNVGAAFTAINAGTHQGAITVDIIADTTEPVSAVLNASGSGAALYTSVNMQPLGGPRVITGSVVGAIIRLLGADNVTIDGRIAGAGRNLTVTNSSAAGATAAIWLSSAGVGAGATNNVIRNLEIACGATQNSLTVVTIGILMNGATISVTAGGDDNDNNSFIANRIIRTRYGIVTRGQAANNNINPVVTDNLIGPAAFGPDEIGKTAILMQADTGAIVSRNVIQFVGGCLLGQTCTAGADRVGIGIGSEAWSTTATAGITAGDYTVTKNIIHDIVEERTFSAVGILAGTTRAGVATNNLIANNVIYNIRANATPGDQVVGIGISGGHTDRIIHNSIAISGDMDPGAATASSVYGNAIRISVASSAAHANLTLANNSIFMDVSSNTATLPFFAITMNSAAYSFGTGLMNNNNLFVNLGNAQMNTGGLSATSTAPTGATLFNTLAQWQTALTVPQDAASIQLNPLYNSNTADLHISGISPNLEAALNLAVADDIDGQVRPNGPNPDIGADEFYPTPGTVQFSSATYSVTEAGLTATITVTRAGGSSGAASVNYATVAGGSAIGGAACGGPVDYIDAAGTLNWANNDATPQTFIVTICNDGASESSETVSLALSNAVTAALGTPTAATLTIVDSSFYSGSVNVGTTETFTSLTNPGGIFEALNSGGLSGNTVINITSDLAGETGAVALNQWLEQGAGGYSLTIKPSGAPRVITGTASAVAVIKLNGADRVTLDGSTSGGTDRSLTITSTNPTTTTAVVWIASASASNGATNNTIRNTILSGNSSITTAVVILAGSGTTYGGAAESPNSNNTLRNNLVFRAQNAAFLSGAAGLDQNWLVTGNTFGSAVAAEKMSFRGMLIANAQDFAITNNTIMGVISTATSTATMTGIQLASTLNIGTISGNTISDIKQINTGGWGCNGIHLGASSAASDVMIANNFISDVAAFGFAGATFQDNGYGIMVVSGGGYNIYHNSIALTTEQGGGAANGITAAINVAAALPAGSLDIRDNIFANLQTLGTRYAIYSASANTVFAEINHNDYFPAAGSVGFLSGARAALTDWQTATGQDLNSISANPLFISATNLHLQTCAGSPAGGAGTPVPGVVTDFDGDTRSAINPDIGADEISRQPVTSSAGSNGMITPSGVVQVTCGGNQLFTITPSPGYTVLDVLVDGVSVGAVSNYTFTNVIVPHSIVASFRTNIGAVPDRLSLGTPLTISKNILTPNNLDLMWGDSCGAAQSDFAVYEGTIGTWYSHASRLCTTAGAFNTANLIPAVGSAYYLIVPLSATTEGSYGTNSLGAQIPQGTGACFAPSDTSSCN